MKALRGAEDRFSNDDVAIEILSLLPTDRVPELKCVCKRWCALFSNPSYISAHFQRTPRTISGLFVQGIYHCRTCERNTDADVIDYISFGKEGKNTACRKILDFLPEKVSVIASCYGVLLCRNIFQVTYKHGPCDENKEYPKKLVLYVCNPFTKEWTSVTPRGRYKNGHSFGFAYHPIGCSSSQISCTNTTFFSFDIVMVQRPLKLGKDPYRFKIYSTKSGKWRRSKEVCTLSHGLYLHQSCYADGVFYWMTIGHSVLAFDLKHETSQVINLPGHNMILQGGVCVGVSEGKMHYICANIAELVVWILEYDDNAPKWTVKHSKPTNDIHHPLLDKYEKIAISYRESNRRMRPFAFQDDILFMEAGWSMCTYNTKIGKIEEELCSFSDLYCFRKLTVLPYCKSLLQVQAE